VELDVQAESRCQEQVEVAAYYVVSEALTTRPSTLALRAPALRSRNASAPCTSRSAMTPSAVRACAWHRL